VLYSYVLCCATLYSNEGRGGDILCCADMCCAVQHCTVTREEGGIYCAVQICSVLCNTVQ